MAAGVRQDPMWPALEAITHTIAYDGRVMGDTQSGDPAALARFAEVTVPTLVLAGSESPGRRGVLRAPVTWARSGSSVT